MLSKQQSAALKRVIPARCKIPALTLAGVIDGHLVATDCDMTLSMPAPDLPEGSVWTRDGLPVAPNHVKGIGTARDLPRLLDPTDWHPARDIPKRALQHVSRAMSDEETRYYLKGVCFESTGVLVATDGHRLFAWHEHAHDPETVAFDGEARIVPRAAITLALALAGKAASIAVDFSADGRQARLTVPGATVTTKLIDGSFPAWRRVVPQIDGHARVTVPAPRALAKWLAGQPKGARDGDPVRLTNEGATLLIKKGDITHTVEVPPHLIQCEGLVKPAGFNARYVADMLAIFDGGGPLAWHVDPASPSAARAPGLLHVLVPMRV